MAGVSILWDDCRASVRRRRKALVPFVISRRA